MDWTLADPTGDGATEAACQGVPAQGGVYLPRGGLPAQRGCTCPGGTFPGIPPLWTDRHV